MPEGNYCLPEEEPEYIRKKAILDSYEDATDEERDLFWDGVILGSLQDAEDFILENWRP